MSNSIKISKPGKDVFDSQDNDLVFNSNYPLFKIHKKGSDKIAVNGTDVSLYTIKHDVGKIPMYFVRGNVMQSVSTKTDYYFQYPYSTPFGSGAYGFSVVKPYIDKLEIYWSYPGIGNQTIYFDYWIFEDPITL